MRGYLPGRLLCCGSLGRMNATGVCVSAFHHSVSTGFTSRTSRMLCSDRVGGRPFSCLSCLVEENHKGMGYRRMVLWDVATRDTTYVDFKVTKILSMAFLSFGSTDSIIIGGGDVTCYGLDGKRRVIVWELEMCATTKSLHAVIKSLFDLEHLYVMHMCYNPLMNAIFYLDHDREDRDRLDRFIVVNLATGAQVAAIEAPDNTFYMQFLRVQEVVLL